MVSFETQVKNLDINQTIVEAGRVYYLVDVDYDRRIGLFQMESYPGGFLKKGFDEYVYPYFTRLRGFEHIDKELIVGEEGIRPKASTRYSAAYDFFSPVDCEIAPGEHKKIYTNIKAYMQPGEVLLLDVRSSVGIDKHLMLSNTIGVIDADYYNNPNNGGNIIISLYNYGTEVQTIKRGDKIAQGWFTFALPSDNGRSDVMRVGGVGSTGR